MQKKPKKQKPVVAKDLVTMDPNHPLYPLNKMLMHDVYVERIKQNLYLGNKLSVNGLLNNDYILDIPLIAKRDTDGSIMLCDEIVKEIARFTLAETLNKSDSTSLIALLVAHDDELYDVLLKRIKGSPDEELFNGEDVVDATGKAYYMLTSQLVEYRVSKFVYSNKDIELALIAKRDEEIEKAEKKAAQKK